MKSRGQKDMARAQAKTALEQEIAANEASGFDLDDAEDMRLEIPEQKAPLYDLAFLREVLTDPARQPAGCIVKATSGGRDYSYHMPGHIQPLRLTTDPGYYEDHAESCELWSPGSPAFPWAEEG